MSIPTRRISVTFPNIILGTGTGMIVLINSENRNAWVFGPRIHHRFAFAFIVFYCLTLGQTLQGLCEDTQKNSPNKEAKFANNSDKALVRIERDVVFSEGLGYKLTADLYRPVSDELCPIVIMIHGGAWIAGDKWQVADHAKQMARSGFVVMAINYRLSPKFQWPAHLDDCFAALDWMKSHADQWKGDTNRIGTWGYSAGAQLALMTAMNPRENSSKIKAVVAGGAPCDLTFVPENTKALSVFLGGTRSEVPERYRDASPISFISKDDPPAYFFHGEEDFLVPLSNSLEMRDSLVAAGIQAIHRTVLGKGHLIAFLDPQARLEAIQFLQTHLK